MRKGPAKKLSLLLAVLFSSTFVSAQVVLNGGFVEDSIGIGEEFQFWLTATYPVSAEVILPDSNYSFQPYELTDRSFIPTQVRNELAFDSVVYTLQSFEIDPVQYLQLKAVLFNGSDSLFFESNDDSVYFRALAPIVSDTTHLRSNIAYSNVSRQFNYPLLWSILTAFIILVFAGILIFGKRIRRQWRIKRLRKEFETFSILITKYIGQLKDSPRPDVAEVALNTWKKYLERLEQVPYTKYTTKEILAKGKNVELKETLKIIDKSVYGKIEQEQLYKSFQEIEDFTQHRYSMALDNLKNDR